MQTLDSLDCRDRRVLIRADLDVPLSGTRTILDDTRIRAALPTVHHVLEQGGSCVVMAHLGRPGGKPDRGLRLAPVAARLAELLPHREVRHCDEVVGEAARALAESLPAGGVLLLQNLRFHSGEQAGDGAFAGELASLGHLYVNDAFAACHRRHASIWAVAHRFPPERRAAGRLVEGEVAALGPVAHAPAAPVVAVLGGAQVSDRMAILRALADRVDRILVGGALSYTFMTAQGQPTGDSPVEEGLVESARELLVSVGDRLWLPSDHVVARSHGPASGGNLARDGIAEGWTGRDIGPETVDRFRSEIARAATLIWIGTMGRAEDAAYLDGTRRVAEAIAETAEERDATAVVGGGETGAVVRRLGLTERMTHVSTGGGAFLRYIAHGTLPGLQALTSTGP